MQHDRSEGRTDRILRHSVVVFVSRLLRSILTRCADVLTEKSFVLDDCRNVTENLDLHIVGSAGV